MSEARFDSIRLMLSDVDGVLTDGGVIFDNQGIELKRFFIRDGLGVKIWQRAGHRFGLVTGRSSHIVQVRAAELGIDLVRQGIADKLTAVEEILQQMRLDWSNLCYIGDDLPDLPVIRKAALGVAVADAAAEVRHGADYVTTALGGAGVVRETVELVLKDQQRWDELIHKYVA